MPIKPSTLLNRLTHLELKHELAAHGGGLSGEDEVGDLNLFLGFRPEIVVARYAPSIITRSEVELFSISMPRFAVRVYLNDHESFVNCRRLNTFVENATQAGHSTWGTRDPKLTADQILRDFEPTTNVSLSNLLSQGRIADGLLVPPPSLASEFRILQAHLGLAYGEAEDARRDFLGTPFMKNIDIGGGLCLQAVCFMATSLLERYATGVCGLGEVTALAAPPHHRELSTSGLDLDTMVRYFDKVALRATLQVPNNAPIRNISQPHTFQHNCKSHLRNFTIALNAYLRSRIPVILPVDISKLAGYPTVEESIYAKNRFNTEGDNLSESHVNNHAIILIGIGRTDKTRVLFNDPAVWPFMQASVEELATVSYFSNMTNMHAAFAPVTPAAVQLPLMWWTTPTLPIYRPGLYQIANDFIRTTETGPDYVPRPTDQQSYLLVTLFDLPSAQLTDEPPRENEPERQLLRDLVIDLNANFGIRKDQWIWVQSLPHCVRLWNAEIEWQLAFDSAAPNGLSTLAKHFLLASLTFTDLKWHQRINCERRNIVLEQTMEASVTPEGIRAAPHNLQIALLTSFCIHNFGRKEMQLPSSVKYLELYAFMNKDAEALFRPHSFNPKSHCTAIARELMANSVDQPVKIAIIADQIRQFAGTRDVIAIATFLPELMAMEDNRSIITSAQNALRFVIQLARELKTVKVVELVAGSRVNGIWRGRNVKTNEIAYIVNRLDTHSVVARLIERLKPIVREALTEQPHIQLALEFEPGPLFAFGEDKQCFIHLVDQLMRAGEDFRNVVGLNLDIPHWDFLGGIRPEWIEENPTVRQLIRHVHVSDHAKGHFCDDPVATIHPNGFRKWIDFLADLSRDGDARFSRFVSIEMECVKDWDMIRRSVAETEKLLT